MDTDHDDVSTPTVGADTKGRVMKQRNKVFAGVSLAVAAVAVGGGAMVSAERDGQYPRRSAAQRAHHDQHER